MEEKTIHFRPPLWLPPLVAVIVGFSYVAGKKIESRGAPPTIAVTGEGKMFAVPDIAELSFGVQTGRQSSAQVAMEKLQRAMNAVIDAVKVKGIEEKDIRTESLWLNPAYDWDDGRQIPRGFEVNQSLRVKIRDLEKIGEVLGAATAAGANQAGGVSFTIDDPEVLRSQAREKAIAQAKEKALVLAEQLGVALAKLKGFNEGFGGIPPPIYARGMMMEAGMGGGGDLPVPSGEQEITVTVTLTYEVR